MTYNVSSGTLSLYTTTTICKTDVKLCHTVKPLILALLLPTTLKRYCIQIFAARYFRELVRLAKFAR